MSYIGTLSSLISNIGFYLASVLFLVTTVFELHSLFFLPPVVQIIATVYLNISICRAHKYRLFYSDTPEEVSKLDFGMSVLKEISSKKKIKKEMKHAKM